MKQLFFVSILLWITSIATAQLHFGVKAGANLASVNTEDAKFVMGMHAGVFVNHTVLGPITVQPEVLYSQQGSKKEIFSDVFLKMKYNYLSIPVMIQYNANFAPGLFFNAGPQISFLMSAKHKPDEFPELDVKEEMNSHDFSVAMGAGYKHPNIPVGIYGRYTHGLSAINKSSDGMYKASNKVVQVGLFYQF